MNSAIGRWTLSVGCWTFAATAAISSAQQVSTPVEKTGVIIRTRVVQSANPKIIASASVSSAARKPPEIQPLQWEPTFIPYTLPQSPDFKAAPNAIRLPGSFVLPVFAGYPDRDYEIIGCVWFQSPPSFADPRTEAIRIAAKFAKARGADALLLNPTVAGMEHVFMSSTAVRWRGK